MRTLIHHNKRLFVLLFALGAASAACALLLWHRMQTMSSTSYLWLIKPNLALAWVPLLAATAIRLIWTVRRRLTWTMLPLGCLWLLFLPNAPYMVTDLAHLAVIKEGMPLYFDPLLNAFAAFTALIAGFVSLSLLQDVVRSLTCPVLGWLFSLVVLLLSSIGVYLGRFLRWNSWDLLSHPGAILRDSLQALAEPAAVSFIGVFMLFVTCSYWVFACCFHMSRPDPASR
ncbi:DUF1361 domain-containing protein [Brevibacillus sp. LEMMJ03]|uniref:DUF1361 domain-containing protein n=1 Tax=Brevibacillus sp. LEMMJ03 TaxID=2595056 RepID=UPI00117F6694|nr:DUF1361 domain-containing protein [Brevibacillus sp. LEMMJ03]TRY27497.1 DUF1361 domain-containing protein [Brevibacillus sp. LEMMJ03]